MAKGLGTSLTQLSGESGTPGGGGPLRRGGQWKVLLRRLTVPFLVGVAAMAALAWMVYFIFGPVRVETAENVPSVPWLPQGARNVSYYHSYLWKAHEFDIDEQGFLAWAKGMRVTVERIGAEPFEIRRYSAPAADGLYPPELGPDATPEEVARREEAAERYWSLRKKVIHNGHAYREVRTNGGGVWVGYDLDTGRAYFYSAAR